MKLKVLSASVSTFLFMTFAAAQNAAFEYKTATQALEALRAKNGVKISEQAGWTVIEDRSTLSLWSFTPPGHPANPAAIHRTVVQKGDNVFIDMKVLCEAGKDACDALVAEFQNLNQKVGEKFKR